MGGFNSIGGLTVNRIARWDGAKWHPLTACGDSPGVSGVVETLTVWNGFLVAAGGFTEAGRQTVNHIARWDGCVIPDGACCLDGVALDVKVPEPDCLAVGGVYQGDFTDPNQVTCPQPTTPCAGELNDDGV